MYIADFTLVNSPVQLKVGKYLMLEEDKLSPL